MDTLDEKPLRLPTVIQVKINEDSITHYIIDGNILKKSKTCILLEETTLWEKSKDGDYSPSSSDVEPERKRPYVVILCYKDHDLLDSTKENDARFFDNLEDALRYYSCFTTIEAEGKDLG